MKTIAVITLGSLLTFPVFSQVLYHGGIYLQDFNGLDSGTTMVLSWPTNYYSGFVLESSPDPTVPVWETVTNTPVTQGYEFMLEIAADGPVRSYRLKSQ